MIRFVLTLALIFGSIALWPSSHSADAQERPEIWSYRKHDPAIPFPRSGRAQTAWASGACWSECGSYCAWGMNSCLQRNSQGDCVLAADACDRYCQRTCRPLFSSGPLLPYIDLPLVDYPIVK